MWNQRWGHRTSRTHLARRQHARTKRCTRRSHLCSDPCRPKAQIALVNWSAQTLSSIQSMELAVATEAVVMATEVAETATVAVATVRAVAARARVAAVMVAVNCHPRNSRCAVGYSTARRRSRKTSGLTSSSSTPLL